MNLKKPKRPTFWNGKSTSTLGLPLSHSRPLVSSPSHIGFATCIDPVNLQLYVSCWRRRHLSLITYSSHTKGRSETSHRLLIQLYYILLSKNIQLYYKHQRYIIHVEESLLHEVAPQDHRSRDIYRFGSS